MHDKAAIREYHSAGCTITPARRHMLREGVEVEVEAKVLDLIVLLVANHLRALDKQEVIEALWGRRPITDAALSQLIYKARRACGDDGERQAVIRTIHGRGLQWVAPVHETVMEAPPPVAAAVDQPTTPAAPPRRNRRRRAWPTMAAAALFAMALFTAAWLWPRSGAGSAHAPARVAVLPITNATGNDSLDWTTRGLPGLIASLLQPHDFEVVDPAQVAKAWDLAPPRGRDHAEHVRFATGADVIVEGRLRKLGDKLYELAIRIERGGSGPDSEWAVTGGDPGTLGVAAAARIGRVLGRSSTPAGGEMPRDGFLMESFARGLELALRQDWQAALPHFALVAHGEPAFLPARYRLGQAQGRTDRQAEASTTLEELVEAAQQADRPDLAAKALGELAYLATHRHAYADAMALLERARPFADASDNPEIRAELALAAARASARLGRLDAAEADLEAARAMVSDHDLRQLLPGVHNVEIFLADGRGDYRALEASARAALAANEALGNERSSMGSLFNLGYALENQGRGVEALPLWARVWKWARRNQDFQIYSQTGYYLAATLQDSGLAAPADAVAGIVFDAARRADDPHMQSLMLRLRAGSQWLRGDGAAALQSSREAAALLDADNDPQGLLATWIGTAFVALDVDPASLPAMMQRADALVAAQPSPEAFGFHAGLLHALGAAASGDRAGAHAALVAAAQRASGAADRNDLRQVALRIATATDDAGAAEFALADFDAAESSSRLELQLVEQWARSRHRDDLADAARQRREALRDAATQALHGLDLAEPDPAAES